MIINNIKHVLQTSVPMNICCNFTCAQTIFTIMGTKLSHGCKNTVKACGSIFNKKYPKVYEFCGKGFLNL